MQADAEIAAIGADNLEEALLAELLAIGSSRLGDSIGVEKDRVSLFHLNDPFRVDHPLVHPEDEIGVIEKAE